jgi:protein-tyrosine-phosphatase
VELDDRVRTYSALADRRRLAIVDALALGDRTPQELAELVAAPMNLIAHHLGVLEQAGLVDRHTSSGDRRRRYVVLRSDRLEIAARQRVATPRLTIFVCTHNSARSQFAAGYWRSRSGLPASSAGSDPAREVHPLAVSSSRRYGVDLASQRPRSYGEVTERPGLVVSVCDRARELDWPFEGPSLHWSIPDPVTDGRAAAFDEAFAAIRERVDRLAAACEQTS